LGTTWNNLTGRSSEPLRCSGAQKSRCKVPRRSLMFREEMGRGWNASLPDNCFFCSSTGAFGVSGAISIVRFDAFCRGLARFDSERARTEGRRRLRCIFVPEGQDDNSPMFQFQHWVPGSERSSPEGTAELHCHYTCGLIQPSLRDSGNTNASPNVETMLKHWAIVGCPSGTGLPWFGEPLGRQVYPWGKLAATS